MTSQDLVKGLDLTGVTGNPTASQVNQIVDTGRLASDKGMVIETEDSALNTPVVPNPAATVEGVEPTWWNRYIWRRVLHSTSTEEPKFICYGWDDEAVSDATLLKWIRMDSKAVEALADIAIIESDLADVESTAATAEADAAAAVVTANAANAAVTVNTNAVSSLNVRVGDVEDLLDLLYAPGDIKPTAATTVFSTTADEHWLECVGTAVSRTVFADLFTAIGTTYGVGDGSTTFNLPDYRGRGLIGAGTGSGLTARVLGTNYGAEGTSLVEANIPSHGHGFVGKDVLTDTINTGTFGDRAAGDDVTLVTGTAYGADPVTPASVMQPSTAVRWLIKT